MAAGTLRAPALPRRRALHIAASWGGGSGGEAWRARPGGGRRAATSVPRPPRAASRAPPAPRARRRKQPSRPWRAAVRRPRPWAGVSFRATLGQQPPPPSPPPAPRCPRAPAPRRSRYRPHSLSSGGRGRRRRRRDGRARRAQAPARAAGGAPRVGPRLPALRPSRRGLRSVHFTHRKPLGRRRPGRGPRGARRARAHARRRAALAARRPTPCALYPPQNKIATKGKGILAMDESNATCGKVRRRRAGREGRARETSRRAPTPPPLFSCSAWTRSAWRTPRPTASPTASCSSPPPASATTSRARFSSRRRSTRWGAEGRGCARVDVFCLFRPRHPPPPHTHADRVHRRLDRADPEQAGHRARHQDGQGPRPDGQRQRRVLVPGPGRPCPGEGAERWGASWMGGGGGGDPQNPTTQNNQPPKKPSPPSSARPSTTSRAPASASGARP